MKKISDRSRKIITYAIFLLLTLLFTKMCTYPPLSHNPQGEYCEIQAYHYTKDQRLEDLYSFLRKKAFVEIDGKFVPYNHSLHKDYELAFVECDGCNIHLSNSNSNGYPCTLTKDFYRFYAFLFIVFFLFFHLAIYPLVKPKNQKQKGNKIIKNNKPKWKFSFKKIVAHLVFILFLLLFTKTFIYPEYSRNSKGEYCEIQASLYAKEEKAFSFHKKSFVEIDDKFVPYNHVLHSGYKVAFIECDTCHIGLSNSRTVDGNPCIIIKNFYNRYVSASVIVFLFFYLAIYPLIKIKKPITTGDQNDHSR